MSGCGPACEDCEPCRTGGGWRVISPSRVGPQAPMVQPMEWSSPPSTGSPSWVASAMGATDPEPTFMGSLNEYTGHPCMTTVQRNEAGQTSEQPCSGVCGPMDVSHWKDNALRWLDYADGEGNRAVLAISKMGRVAALRQSYEALPSGAWAVASRTAADTVDAANAIAREVECIVAVGKAKLEAEGKPPPPPQPEPSPEPDPEPDDGGTDWKWPWEGGIPGFEIPWWVWAGGAAAVVLFVSQSPQARAYREYRSRGE